MVRAELQIGWLGHTRSLTGNSAVRCFGKDTVFLPILRATVSKYVEIWRVLEIDNAIIPENDIGSPPRL
jgi:hypothetical protein